MINASTLLKKLQRIFWDNLVNVYYFTQNFTTIEYFMILWCRIARLGPLVRLRNSLKMFIKRNTVHNLTYASIRRFTLSFVLTISYFSILLRSTYPNHHLKTHLYFFISTNSAITYFLLSPNSTLLFIKLMFFIRPYSSITYLFSLAKKCLFISINFHRFTLSRIYYF